MSSNRSFRDLLHNLWFGSGNGEPLPTPETGPQRLWLVVRTHYMGLIGLNLLFILLCLPIITIPAALSGMTNILVKWTHDEVVDFFPDFFAEFRADFLKRLLVGLALIIAPLSFSLYPMMLGWGREGTIVLLVILGAVSFLIQSYLYPIFVMVNIPVGAAFRNASFLTVLEWKTSIRVLLTSGVIYAICFIFTLYAIPFLIIILISLNQLTACVWVTTKITERLVVTED